MTPSHSGRPRALALDALRGLSILLMVFSGRIPFGVLPDWMYHAQVPPPLHVFRPDLPGITWVDLVFPFFLFAMGAAIPLALGARLTRGESVPRVVAGVFRRGLLLAAFAIFVMHIRPWPMADTPGTHEWLLALTGFLLLFPMVSTLPPEWTPVSRHAVRAAGWIGAAVLMATVRFSDGSGFSVHRSDIIILVLSNVAVAGSLIWLASRNSLVGRLTPLAFILALRLTHTQPGLAAWIWDISPLPWLFQIRFLQYLFLTIPGTIAGDMIVERMQRPPHDSRSWSVTGRALIAFGMVSVAAGVVIGFKERFVAETSIAALVLLGITWWATRRPGDEDERLVSRLISLGILLFSLGCLLEPFEGGIKKDHSTLSYYFVTGGLSVFVLVVFVVLIDMFRVRRGMRLLIECGQNPLVAYAGVNSLVPPILGLTGLDRLIERLTPTPWLGVLRGGFYTYLVALASALCTKVKLTLRT